MKHQRGKNNNSADSNQFSFDCFSSVMNGINFAARFAINEPLKKTEMEKSDA